MRFEQNLQDHEPRLVNGTVGLNRRRFQRRFANQAKMEAWMDSAEFVDRGFEIFQIERL